jgi:hypothetical protein
VLLLAEHGVLRVRLGFADRGVLLRARLGFADGGVPLLVRLGVLDEGVALQAWRRAILSDPASVSADLKAHLGGRTTVEFLRQLSYHHHHGMQQRLHQSLLHEKRPRRSWLLLGGS